FACDEPGLAQDLEVVADRGLALADRFDQVARADGTVTARGQDAEQTQTHGVAERREPAGQHLCLVRGQGTHLQRRAAALDVGLGRDHRQAPDSGRHGWTPLLTSIDIGCRVALYRQTSMLAPVFSRRKGKTMTTIPA